MRVCVDGCGRNNGLSIRGILYAKITQTIIAIAHRGWLGTSLGNFSSSRAHDRIIIELSVDTCGGLSLLAPKEMFRI